MKLFLHVGTHKTGSTHLQIYLRRHATELAEQGLLYPDVADWFGGPSMIAHHKLVAAASLKKAKLNSRREKLEEVRLAAKPGETLLISAEPAYRRTYPDDCPPADLWEGRRRYVDRLKRMTAGYDATIVICFRNRATFGESHYGSVVKSGYAGGFDDYLVDHGFMFDYERQRALFEASFGDVRVYDYEEAAREGVSATFLRKIGFSAPAPDERPPTRRSPDPRMFLWMARQNGLSSGGEGPARGERIAFSTSAAAASVLPDSERATLWSDGARPFLDRFGDRGALSAVAGRKVATLSAEDHGKLDAAYTAWRASQPRKLVPLES